MPTSNSSKKRIVITMGDPSGIGPEVVVKALSDKRVASSAHITVVGDYFMINKIKEDLGLKAEFSLIDLSNIPQNNFFYGKQSAVYGKASMEYLDMALSMVADSKADAVVTAPLNKSSVRSAGFTDFEGHTEYMAMKTGVKDFSMMFVGKALKVTLVTRHLALRDVPAAINTENVYKTIMMAASSMKKFFGVAEPRIGVAGLNPHSGDGGIFGDEESRAIIPAVKKASQVLKSVTGPVPADAIFYEALNGRFDVIVTMYHDQALAPFKMLYFADGVNLTLGLPFVRTSPDHGTAFDIAGKGKADPSSMKEAIRLASSLRGG